MPTLEQVQALRAERYRQRANLRIDNEQEALAFLNDVGISLLFSAADVELPSLWGALRGANTSPPRSNRGREIGLAWRWKDTLPIEGKVLYGKFLRKKPVFIALALAPAFYALSPNYGQPAVDYLIDYQDGLLSIEARQVYEALLASGALPTSRLRREASLSGKANAGRFDRALAELQMQFRITKVATSDANRWGYMYVYDLFHHHFPAIVAAARNISGAQARETILLRYLHTVVAATEADIARLFGWTPRDVALLVARLANEQKLRAGIQIEGLDGEYLILG
ncbi:MAG: winged helix DNA-binding domain-containing protein [Anaerolineae bacterium]|nr:winged helix DNA-binding domain-containing protein [Anaerolineae bacterium]